MITDEDIKEVFLDKQFLDEGMEVFSYEFAQKLRKDNLELKRKGKRSFDIIPQAGFQEKVLTSLADLVICGGTRGAGKTAVGIIGTAYYAYNPDVTVYGFRRYENDVRRGIWKSSKQLLRGMGSFADTTFEFKFFGGSGATFKMEHLADLAKIKDRFRGAEMPYIVVEELAEFTRDNLNVIFDLIGSNRSTAGVKPRFICTCNPVGKANKLRHLLDWWIDPETDEAIPERSGKLRYFCRYGEDVTEIAWGNTPEEVYANPAAKAKIASMTDDPDRDYMMFITSMTFIDGDFSENEILRIADPKYMNRISSGGSKSVVNDIKGVWRDIDDGDSILTTADMDAFYVRQGVIDPRAQRFAGGDIAIKDDLLVLWASAGYHIIDVEMKRGLNPDEVKPFIFAFLEKNKVPMENFCFDSNGIGAWLKMSDGLEHAMAFDNRSAAEDRLAYRSRKAECAGKLIDLIARGPLTIDPDLLTRKYTRKKQPYTVDYGLKQERLILKWAGDENPKELIRKKDMKLILGYSPDLMESLIYLVNAIDKGMATRGARRGNWGWFGGTNYSGRENNSRRRTTIVI